MVSQNRHFWKSNSQKKKTSKESGLFQDPSHEMRQAYNSLVSYQTIEPKNLTLIRSFKITNKIMKEANPRMLDESIQRHVPQDNFSLAERNQNPQIAEFKKSDF
jgi:hypothetical protein